MDRNNRNVGFTKELTIFFSEYDPETNMEYFKDVKAYDEQKKKQVCYIPHVEFEDADADKFTSEDIDTLGIGYNREDIEDAVFEQIETIADELNSLPNFYGHYKAEFVKKYARELFLSLQGECPETRLDEIDGRDFLDAFMEWFGDLQ